MIIPNGFRGYSGDLFGDLAAQDIAAENKRVEPSSPIDFIKWIRETLRDQRDKYDKLASEHSALTSESESALIGLKRLESLTNVDDRKSLDYLSDMHRSLTHTCGGIDRTLDRCKKILDETTVNYQLIGETLKSALADKDKKIAMQKEIGLRLQDVEDQFLKCFQSVAEQKQRQRQLSTGIQQLMNKANIKLPPKLRESINKEDKINQIALAHRKNLQAGKDYINPSKGKTYAVNGLGESDFDIKFGAAAFLVGAIAGSLLFFKGLS